MSYKIRLKSKKDSFDDIMCKTILNSSYGKFGINLEKENELYHGDDVVHAIHPTGILKKISLNKNLFFYERYPDLHKEYVYCEKNRLPKKLLPKS